MEDMDIGTIANFCCNLLLGSRLVANEANDEVLWVVGDLLDEFELNWSLQKSYTKQSKVCSPQFPSILR